MYGGKGASRHQPLQRDNGHDGKAGFGKLCEAEANFAVSQHCKGITHGKGGWDEPAWRSVCSDNHRSVFWLTLASESRLAKCGLPPDAPVIEYDSTIPLLPYASSILEDVVGESAWNLVFEHDTDWINFPEVGAALKEAGGPEQCLCVATCPKVSFWGVGLAPGWKNRESAARLALCVALAVQLGKVDNLSSRYPGFSSLCNTELDAEPHVGFAHAHTRSHQTWGHRTHVEVPAASSQYFPATAPFPTTAPALVWIKLEGGSRLLDMGFGPEAPTISYDKSLEIFRCAHNMLADLVGDVTSEVMFHHDPDWLEFPEVAAAMRAASAESNCFAVATCPNVRKWAVGIGGAWKTRETAAKLALCMALESSPSQAESTRESTAMLENITPAAVNQDQLCPLNKRRRLQDESGTTDLEQSPHSGDETHRAPLLQDKPIWIQLPVCANGVLAGLPTEAIAVSTDAKSRKALYNSIDKVLARLIPKPETDIEYHDDSDWTLFPEVVTALRQHGNPDGCLHIAIHRSSGAWGAGLSSKWRGRCIGAKIALAAMLALKSAGEIALADLQDFAEFVMEVQTVT